MRVVYGADRCAHIAGHESLVSVGDSTPVRELFLAVASALGVQAPVLVTIPESSVQIPAPTFAVALEHGRVHGLKKTAVWVLSAAVRYPTQDTLARALGKSPRTVQSQIAEIVAQGPSLGGGSAGPRPEEEVLVKDPEKTGFREVVADVIWRAFVDEPREDSASGVHRRVGERRRAPSRRSG